MTRNMFKLYKIKNLWISTENFNTTQDILNSYGIKFSVVFLKDELGIIAYEIEEGSETYNTLKSFGFDKD